MSDQTSTPEESYENLDDSLSFSASAGSDAAPQAAADTTEVEELAGASTDEADADAAVEDADAPEPAEGDEEPVDADASDADADEEPASEEPEEEDPLVQLKMHLRSSLGEWYVIHSYSGHENRVKRTRPRSRTARRRSSAECASPDTSWCAWT